MDFDYSTILYVILGIIYFIFTGVNKNKKKTQGGARKSRESSPETLGPPPVNRRPTFEELLEEFTGQKPLEPEPEPIPIVEEVVAPVIVTEPVNKYPVRVHSRETRKKDTPMVAFKGYEEVEELETESYAEMFADLDGAKRAFIASEIFQRKY